MTSSFVAAVLLASCENKNEQPAHGLPLPDLSLRSFGVEGPDGCLTSGCHGELIQQRWVHGPIAAQACSTCHLPDGANPEPHRFRPTTPVRDLCSRCHAATAAEAYIHEPYGSANCTGCHNPHGGERKDYLLTEQVEQLCRSCHPSTPVKVGHRPYEEGSCLSCHEAHSSRHEHLLLRREGELCSACHGEFRAFLAENILEEALVAEIHPALLTEGCLACHQAHGSDRPAMMRAELHTNCTRCHSDLLAAFDDAEVVHAAFGREDSCVTCHTPHASVYDGLLRESPSGVCFQCHAEEVQMESGRVIGSIQQQIADAKVVHLPVAEGDCTVCHMAHFSSERSLLRLKYPHKIYGAFSGGSYELCFQCHDRQLVEVQGRGTTGFRNGDLNLHFVHVNREKGRACDICHDPHASDERSLIRETFPFGPSRWPMPLGFIATENGGSCASACHEELSYTR